MLDTNLQVHLRAILLLETLCTVSQLMSVDRCIDEPQLTNVVFQVDTTLQENSIKTYVTKSSTQWI